MCNLKSTSEQSVVCFWHIFDLLEKKKIIPYSAQLFNKLFSVEQLINSLIQLHIQSKCGKQSVQRLGYHTNVNLQETQVQTHFIRVTASHLRFLNIYFTFWDLPADRGWPAESEEVCEKSPSSSRTHHYWQKHLAWRGVNLCLFRHRPVFKQEARVSLCSCK